MAKKTRSKTSNVVDELFSPSAQALIPTDSAEVTSDMKLTKADLVNILSVGLTETISEELALLGKQREELDLQYDAARLDVEAKHLAAAKKDAILPGNPDLHVRFHINYVNQTSIEVNAEYNTIRAKPSLAKNHVEVYKENMGYSYVIDFPPELAKIREKTNNLDTKINKLKSKLSRVSKTSYVKAQIDLGLISSTKNGTTISQNLMDQVKTLSERILKKDDTE